MKVSVGKETKVKLVIEAIGSVLDGGKSRWLRSAANPLAQTQTTLQQRRPNYSHNNERTSRNRSPPPDCSIFDSPEFTL